MLKRFFGGEWDKAFREGYRKGLEDGFKRSEEAAKGYSRAQRIWAESWMAGYIGVVSESGLTGYNVTMQMLSVACGARVSTLSNPKEFLQRLGSNIEYIIREAQLSEEQVEDLRWMYDCIVADHDGASRFIRDISWDFWGQHLPMKEPERRRKHEG